MNNSKYHFGREAAVSTSKAMTFAHTLSLSYWGSLVDKEISSMQGQRGTIGSLPETIEFDCGSTSSATTVDQHIFWNNMRNPAENQYVLSPGDINPSYVNSINHEWQNLSGWSLGEPSSSSTQNEVTNNEQKRELGLSSSVSSGAIAGPRLEERRFEPNNTFSLDNVNTSPMYMRSSNSHLVPQTLNLNASLADSGNDNSYHVGHPSNLNKSSGPVNEHIPPTIGSGPFLLPSGTNGFLVEDTDGRPLDTRRVSCKRKAAERNVGPSSDSGSSSYSQHTDGSAWNTLPTHDYGGSSFNRSAPTEQVNARLGLSTGDGASESMPGSNGSGSSESFHRNFRLRVNPSSQQISIPPTSVSSGNVIRNSGVSSSSPMLQRFHPVDNSLDLRGLSSGANPFERPGDGEFGIPYSLRSLAVAGEGSSRLVSELRNVLGLMRRGGNLRYEDVMILDHSVFSGIADIHDRHRDMRLDVDNMSYEELLALEERIGNVSTGLSEETVLKLLKKKKYSAEPGSQHEAEPCCVCQEEYKDGDDMGTLDCGHDYHTDCIKQWLMHKNLCPICKTTGLAT
ncbi:putative E3 ubiquitin-protein ligase RHG1A, partial [Mucuna pruriens]